MKEIKDIIQNRNKIRDNILKAFGVEIEKSVAVIGEIRKWSDGEYKKIDEGKWVKLDKNKIVSSTILMKIINSEIDKLTKEFLKQKMIFSENLSNPYPQNSPKYQQYIDILWEDEKKKEFISELLKERKNLFDELSEIKRIVYREKKQKREQKVGKHEIDELEMKDIINKYNLFFSKIDNIAPRYVSAVELMPNVTINDYFLDTETNFHSITNIIYNKDGSSNHPEIHKIWEDMKNSGRYIFKESPKSNSEYLIDKNNGDIYRYSDHWGRVASCIWTLDDYYSGDVSIAKSNIKKFNRRKDSMSVYFNPQHKECVIKTIKNTFPEIKKILTENEKFYVAEKAKKQLVDFCKNMFKKYVNVNSFEVKEIKKLRKKFEFI